MPNSVCIFGHIIAPDEEYYTTGYPVGILCWRCAGKEAPNARALEDGEPAIAEAEGAKPNGLECVGEKKMRGLIPRRKGRRGRTPSLNISLYKGLGTLLTASQARN